MDKEIENAEKIDLSGDDLKEITKGQANIVSYHELPSYRGIDDLLGQYGAVILLYETKRNFGHWVAIMKVNDNTIEFFDSYGYKPDEELKYATYNHEKYLSEMINESNYRVIYNDKKLQALAEDVNTCGRWTGLRVRMREIPLREFQNMFKNNRHYNGDFWASALTYIFTF